MRRLVEGLFPKERLLSYIRDFIVFEVANEKITKKGAKYHQFFAVRLAAAKAVETVGRADRRIGVIWHTTGSGKSLSMAFLVGMLRRRPELENPSFVIQVDRTDLDDQLHDQFVAGGRSVGEVKHAESGGRSARAARRPSGGEVIFTTIEKFRLTQGPRETAHPVLSERSNIIVIADEAHRSQYGFVKGFARYLRRGPPERRRLGFTGTPDQFRRRRHRGKVFGELIHTYDIRQSQEDKATVPIYYAPRQVKMNLKKSDIDAALQEIGSGHEPGELERRKSQWAASRSSSPPGRKNQSPSLAKDLNSPTFTIAPSRSRQGHDRVRGFAPPTVCGRRRSDGAAELPGNQGSDDRQSVRRSAGE